MNVLFGVVGYAYTLPYLMQFQKYIEGRLESTGYRLSLEVGDERHKLTVSWTTWLYIDCCCDIYHTGQRSPTMATSHLRY